jgi:hypothetical protein
MTSLTFYPPNSPATLSLSPSLPYFSIPLSPLSLFLSSQGDSTIRYFEITEARPYVFFLTMYQSKDPQRGMGYMPKRELEYMKCEVMRFYKLQTKGLVEPVSMTVPRKVIHVLYSHTDIIMYLLAIA